MHRRAGTIRTSRIERRAARKRPLATRDPRERGGLYARTVAPGFVSQLVANPIWIDVDGDGRSAPAPSRAAGSSDPARRRLVTSAAIVAALGLVWWRLRARARRAGLPRLL